MTLLNDKVGEQVRKEFETLSESVKLVNFTQELECESCADTRNLIDVSSGSSGLSQATRDALKTLKHPVHIQVFATLT